MVFCTLRLHRVNTLPGSAACRVLPRQSPPRGTALVPRLGGTAGVRHCRGETSSPRQSRPSAADQGRARFGGRQFGSRAKGAPAATPRWPPGRKLRYRPRSPPRCRQDLSEAQLPGGRTRLGSSVPARLAVGAASRQPPPAAAPDCPSPLPKIAACRVGRAQTRPADLGLGGRQGPLAGLSVLPTDGED